jgi:glycerol uptake facilitator-like aquaporin
MGERLSGGNEAIALLANSAATAGGLYVLILSLAPISGAHFNPAVTLVMALARELPWMRVVPYFLAQAAGAVAGVWTAHAMFGLPILQSSAKVRTGVGQWIGEFVATFGLIACIRLCSRCAPNAVPAAVAAYIGAAYWFTSSTSFANPAVTLARSLSDTFAGIAPSGVMPFVLAQIAGALAAWVACRGLLGPAR